MVSPPGLGSLSPAQAVFILGVVFVLQAVITSNGNLAPKFEYIEKLREKR